MFPPLYTRDSLLYITKIYFIKYNLLWDSLPHIPKHQVQTQFQVNFRSYIVMVVNIACFNLNLHFQLQSIKFVESIRTYVQH